MVYVAPNEAAAILPSATPLGPATVTVNKSGVTATRAINVIPAAFGIFVAISTGGPGKALAFNMTGDGTTAQNSIELSAQPGQDVLINGTGLGAIASDETQSGVADIPATEIKVYVGARQATVVSAGRGVCCEGLDPNFRIPQGVAAWDVIRFTIPDGVVGCFVPVVVQIGKYVSNLATISIDPGGAACTRGAATLPDELTDKLAGKTGISIGALTLGRSTNYDVTGAGAARTTRRDTGDIEFVRYADAPASLFASDVRYPDHVCSIVGFPSPSGGLTKDGQPIPIVPLRATSMDAGAAITFQGPAGTRTVNRQMAGMVVAYRPMGDFGNSTPGNYLDPGSYTITAPGGRDIGAFTATTEVPATPFVWTNPPAAASAFDRSQDFTVTWTGGIPDTQVTVIGQSGTMNFLCAAPVSDGQFTIPSWVFLSLPASTGVIPGSLVLQNGSVVTYTASGLDIPTVRYSIGTGVTLKYQ